MVTVNNNDDEKHGSESDSSDEDSSFRDVLRAVARADVRTPPIHLPKGTPVGPYEIVDLLGRGGMGVVYRAIDTRLGREVALKVLRGSVAGNERRGRFFREARSAASINHPNVATIYEVGESGEHLFQAMELIEGVTLRRRLASGALAVDEALSIVREILQGVAAAHSKGIVHRDLKPENVMVSRRGLVKVLDFGLAKMQLAGKTRDDTLGHRETETLEGAVLGTPAYMAPEQASGKRVDVRADVFALGIVLYELLTGVRPGLLGSGPVIEDEHLAAIVHRCIATAPDGRYANAAEVLEALDARSSRQPRPLAATRVGTDVDAPDSRRMRSTEPTPDAFIQASAVGHASPKPRWRAALFAVGLIAVTISTALVVRRWSPVSVPGASTSAVAAASASKNVTPTSFVETRLTFYPPEVSLPTVAVSFDGRTYAYSDNEALWIASVDGSSVRRRLALPAKETAPPKAIRFFPDGKRLLVGETSSKDDRTWILAIDGGSSVAARNARGFAVSPDGDRIAFNQFDERIVVGSLTGGPTTFIETVRQGSEIAISWSPDGNRLAIGLTLDESCIIQVARADGSSHKTVAVDEQCRVSVPRPVWTANDRIAFQSTGSTTSTALVEVSLTADDVAILPSHRLWTRPSAQLDALEYRDGRFFFVRVESQLDVYVGRLDAQRKLEMSPTRFTMNDDDDRFVGWMPDGRIVYSSKAEGRTQTFAAKLGAPASATPIGGIDLTAFAVLPDGDLMAFRGSGDGAPGHVTRVKQDRAPRDLFAVGPARVERGRELRCAACARTVRRCVVGEVTGEETSFSMFDPENGEKGPSFARLATPNAWACSLSDDGAKLLLPRMTEGLKIVNVDSGAVQAVSAPPGGMIQSINSWPGTKEFIGTGLTVFGHDYAIVRFDSEGGAAEALWASDSIFMSQPRVAPNGRDIAVTTRAFDTDVYMLAPADAK